MHNPISESDTPARIHARSMRGLFFLRETGMMTTDAERRLREHAGSCSLGCRRRIDRAQRMAQALAALPARDATVVERARHMTLGRRMGLVLVVAAIGPDVVRARVWAHVDHCALCQAELRLERARQGEGLRDRSADLQPLVHPHAAVEEARFGTLIERAVDAALSGATSDFLENLRDAREELEMEWWPQRWGRAAHGAIPSVGLGWADGAQEITREIVEHDPPPLPAPSLAAWEELCVRIELRQRCVEVIAADTIDQERALLEEVRELQARLDALVSGHLRFDSSPDGAVLTAA
jgi:hypothetical protein